MAVSDEAARLTKEYKGLQGRLAKKVSREAGKAFAETFPTEGGASFVKRAAPLTLKGEQVTQAVALKYFDTFTLAESRAGVAVSLDAMATPRKLTPGPVVEGLYRAGEGTFNRLVSKGVDREEALRRAQSKVEAKAFNMVAGSGTSEVLHQVRAHSKVGWRRVTDGKPCAFCALLATREDEQVVALPAHDHCGCIAEPVFGETTASAAESRWLDIYYEARDLAHKYGEGASAKNVLWRMNRLDPGAFKTGAAGVSRRRLECTTEEWHAWWGGASKKGPNVRLRPELKNSAAWGSQKRINKFVDHNYQVWARKRARLADSWLSPYRLQRQVNVPPLFSSRSVGAVANLSGLDEAAIKAAIDVYEVTREDILKNLFGDMSTSIRRGKVYYRPVGRHLWIPTRPEPYRFKTIAGPDVTPDDFMRRGLLTMYDPDFIAIDNRRLVLRRDVEGTIWEAQLKYKVAPDGTVSIDKLFSMYPKSGPDAFYIDEGVYMGVTSYNKKLLKGLEIPAKRKG